MDDVNVNVCRKSVLARRRVFSSVTFVIYVTVTRTHVTETRPSRVQRLAEIDAQSVNYELPWIRASQGLEKVRRVRTQYLIEEFWSTLYKHLL